MKNSNYINIKQYLESKGIIPVKDRGYYGMYHSPLRDDSDPSFKVDYEKGLWYDFGIDKGGSIVDLVMKLENCSLAEAFRQIENSFSFHRDVAPAVSPKPTDRGSAIAITGIRPLTHRALLDYLEERGINIGIAKQYCSEVHYSITNKPYFAVGFQNDAGGWELRNRYFKGSNTPKNITTIQNGSNTVMAFEGFIDFLSYLSLKGSSSPAIYTTVLNSITNLQKAIPFLQSHQTVHTFFDNDEAGRKSLASLCDQLKHAEIIDQSVFYRNCKDLNEYWQDKSKPQKQLPETGATAEIKRQIPIRKRGRSL